MSKNVINVTDRTFETVVVNSDIPVLVDFWAPWCGPCKALTPVIEQLAEEYKGRVKVVKLNTQDNRKVPGSMNIRSIPAVLLFDGPNVVTSIVGARPKAAFTKMIDKHLNKGAKKSWWQKVTG